MKTNKNFSIDADAFAYIREKHANISAWVNDRMIEEMQRDKEEVHELTDFEKNKIASEAAFNEWQKINEEKLRLSAEQEQKTKQDLYRKYLDEGMDRDDARIKAGFSKIRSADD